MLESVIAAHIWAILHTPPKPTPEFSVTPIVQYDPIPPVVLKYQTELTQMQQTYHCQAYSQCLNIKSQSNTEPISSTPENGQEGYVATCPDGTPAQGSCETPEGVK